MGLDAVDRILRDAIVVRQEVPGAVVLVRHDQEVLFFESYGARQQIPEELPMTRDTLFDLASVTKPIVCGLLSMLMRQQGKIRLEERPLGALAPTHDPLKSGITLRHLLSNRSGLPAWRGYYQDYRPEDCPVPPGDILQRILAETLLAAPGEKELYSDLGFMILGWFLEQTGQASLDQLFMQEIARPLQLQKTGYRPVGATPNVTPVPEIAATEYCNWRGRMLRGEVHDENCFMLGGVSGHAGLFSTAGDLDRVVAGIFRGLRGETSLFGCDSLKVFLRKEEGSSPGTWALGWDTPSPRNSATGEHFSASSFGHNGFTGTSLWMDLERRISVVLLTNRVHPNRDNLAIRSLRPRVHDTILAGS